MLQGLVGNHVDVDDAHRAEHEFMEESDNAGTHVSGQFRADARKYERALKSIVEDWTKDTYKRIYYMGNLEVRRQW